MKIFKRILVGVLILIGLWTPLLFGVGRRVQVRLDTGDLRCCYFFVPYSYMRMERERRELIRSVTHLAPAIPAEWHTVFRGAPDVENNPHLGLWTFYWEASGWVPVDRRIARFVLEDIAELVRGDGSLEFWSVLGHIVPLDEDDCPHVRPDWRENRGVLDYLDSRGYVPPPTKESAADVTQRLRRQVGEHWNYWHDTPLHMAALGGYVEATRLLLAEGADPNARNDNGETPLDLAAGRGNAEIVELLLTHGLPPAARERISHGPEPESL